MKLNKQIFKKIAIVVWWIGGLLPLCQAQELLCNVSIDASRIQSDKSVFDNMRETITQYINYQKWTGDEFTGQERIRANLQIIVNSRPSPDYFTCTANLQVYRTAYNTTYETLLLNLSDKNFAFTYVPFQQMAFVDNQYTDNLTALLNFYAYILLGFDYDSYGQNGGDLYFRKAQEVVNLASASSNERGWKAAEDDRNRFWLAENLLNSRYKTFHTVVYKYHREGLDMMESNPNNARRAIMDSLKEMQKLNRSNPLLVLTRVFLDAKNEELVSAFGKAFANDKTEFLQIMTDLDPARMPQYNKIMNQ